MNGDYYTAEEAMTKLNKPRSTFFKEVETGLIPFELEAGRQRGRRYPKQAIDILAQRQHTPLRKDGEPTHLIFTPSTPADLWAEVQIGRDLYGEDDIVPYETLLEWRDSNDEIFMVLKDRGQVVGYSSLIPIEESILKRLIQDKLRERDIPARAIKEWTDAYLSVYLATLTVKPSGKPTKDRERGRFLIKETLKWALSLNRQFDIKNWYGIGATKQGQRIFEAVGFTEVATLYGGERKGYTLKSISKPVGLIGKLMKEMERQDDTASNTEIEDTQHEYTVS